MVKSIVAQKKQVSQNNFLAIIKEEWDNLDNNVIVNSIKSMQDRIKACIDAEGGHTKY